MNNQIYSITDKQQRDLITKIKSIKLPESKYSRLFITLRSPVPIWYDNSDLLESKFRTFRDLITRKKSKRNNYGEVGGYFCREYGDWQNGDCSGLHYHLILFDYRPNQHLNKCFRRINCGEPTEDYCSDLERYLKKMWMGLVENMTLPDAPVFLSDAEKDRSLFFAEPINLDKNGTLETFLLDYFKKTRQKNIKISPTAGKRRWFGPVNEKALKYKN